VQFFLNGFHPGDPAQAPVTARQQRLRLEDVDAVDVLIVGSGPAGLVLATQLAQFPAISTRIVERRDGPLQLGQADGVACRTVEMFEAFGLSDQLLKESYWVNETSFWRPDPANPERIVRTGRVQDTEDDLSEFPHVIVNQARLHDYLLGSMRRSAHRLAPDYGVTCVDLGVRPSGSHPVAAELSRDGARFTVNARYVVGCDGARSAVRQAIGRELRGDAANHAWGVMDVLAVTDFPDFRLKCAVQSGAAGNILLIPREGGYMVRLYVDLGEVNAENRARVRAMTEDEVATAASRVLAPYTLDVKQTAWFSIYEVAQRVTDAFDDAAGRSGVPRVFIAGDACHTHSAKAGQGMNVSMQDAFNLGWKLGAVLEGRSRPALLSSYSDERRPVARELIDFDREWSSMLAAAPLDPAHPERGGIDSREVQAYFVRQGRYTAGVATRYPQSALIGPAQHQHLAAGLEVGTRFHSAPVIRVADARRLQLGHTAQADGRWRLYGFADAAQTRLSALCEWLSDDDTSPIRRFTPPQADIDSVIDVRAVLQADHRNVVIQRLPAILHPHKGSFGLLDYEKVFALDPAPGADIFELRQIDRANGCAVIVRPDQFISQVLPLDAFNEVAAFFDAVLLAPSPSRG
jgi:phenol 2-monooxygenase (NADPH)